jgi:FkbM family methyltransferase
MGDEVVQTPFGKFLVDPRDLIGSTLKAGTCWDGPGFLQVIAREHGRLGEPGVTILDVGANQGAFTIWLASSGAWRVVAVEPVPQTMQRLKANLDLNREVTAHVVIPLEVAGYSGRQDLWMPPVDPGNTGGTAMQRLPIQGGAVRPEVGWVDAVIRTCALDDYAWLWRKGLALIKIDAQGCDGRILRGLQQTLKKYRPVVVFEWEAELATGHGDTLEGTLDWLYQQGYETKEWPSQPNNFLALPWEVPCAS